MSKSKLQTVGEAVLMKRGVTRNATSTSGFGPSVMPSRSRWTFSDSLPASFETWTAEVSSLSQATRRRQ
jgi:hypothetical protein